MKLTFNFLRFLILITFLFIFATAIFAQTTAFTYQGRFTDSTLPQPTNGTYEMQFKVFDEVTNGNQFDSTLTLLTVQVVNGIFTVTLDYGALTFRGQDIFLEISVRPVGSANPFTVLNPRQKFTSAPYAIQSFNSRNAVIANNSLNLGGIPADQYVTGQVVRSVNNLVDNVTLVAGSNITITPSGNTLTIDSIGGNGINNQTSQQTTANFNIDGTGTANIFNAETQFNIGGNRVLSVGSGNIFAGSNAGTGNTTGGDNAFVGTNAGLSNLAGFNNSFFGTDSGRTNTGTNNSFFGRSSGFANTTGIRNVFIGVDAGRFNLTGGGNSFIGTSAGNNNTIGANNTIVGDSANVGSNNLTFATAIGSGALVSTSNTVVLGRTADTVVAPNLLQVGALGVGGSLVLCRNGSNQISTCTLAAFGGSFIENSTAPQTSSNFNISGNGTVGATLSANIINSATTYRIGGVNVFGTPNSTSVVAGQLSNYTLLSGNNAFFGYKAGQSSNSFSQANTFIGSDSGESNTGGSNNTFVGRDSGLFNSTGSLNSFFGSGAGQSNSTASSNSFFGYFAGNLNSTGTRNAFFGFQAGLASQTVDDNSFFGYKAGSATIGGGNSFFGSSAGIANGSGSNNSFFGNSSGLANNGAGGNAFFGSSSGLINTSGSQNTFIGNNAGDTNTTGSSNTVVGSQSSTTNGNNNTVIGSLSQADGNQNAILGYNSFSTGDSNISIGYFTSVKGSNNTAVGSGAKVQPFTPGFQPPTFSTAIGAGVVANLDNSVFIGREMDVVRVPGKLNVSGLISGASVVVDSLTVTGGFIKLTVQSPTSGSQVLCLNTNKLVALCSSVTDTLSSGQGAQVESQAAQIKEQSEQISAQAEQIKQQQIQLEALKETVCAMNPAAKICKIK